jgi:hypothetical protein
VALPGLLVDDTTVPADHYGLSVVALVARDELDAAAVMLEVVPVHERRYPQTGLLSAGGWAARVVWAVFRCSEPRFGVRCVVASAGPRERPQNFLLLQMALQRGRPHGVAVVGVQNQWLFKTLADALADAGPAHQIGCDGCVLALGEIAGDDLAVPDINHQVELEPDPPDGGGLVSDVPTPDLTWT